MQTAPFTIIVFFDSPFFYIGKKLVLLEFFLVKKKGGF
uniref:Uncharacterized protein n=1 Tax=Siphoviridae sp. cteZR38 TaxID=2827906 RepID=A0A8S5SP13_9CAUD|nr:MAG TPA: hypothetical protein [Siphoviridae sp. cteZR38]